MIIQDSMRCAASVTEEGHFLADEIDIWIDTLQRMNNGTFKDPKTENGYTIRKLDADNIPSCDKCKYYFNGKDECRKYPPIMVDKQGIVYDRMYPHVPYKDDWCGEFERGTL